MIHLSLKKGKRMTTLTEIQTNGAKWKRALESVRKEAQFAADHGPPDARILAHRILSLFENSATEGCRCFPNIDGTGQNNVRCPVHRDSATEDRARTYLREQMLRALPDATEEQVDELLDFAAERGLATRRACEDSATEEDEGTSDYLRDHG